MTWVFVEGVTLGQGGSEAAWSLLWRRLLEMGVEVSERDVLVGAGGKPYFAGGEVQFNVSHSEKMVAVAISDAAVGVDIQVREGLNLSAISQRMSLSEFCKREADIKKRGATVAEFFSGAAPRVDYVKQEVVEFGGKSYYLSIACEGEWTIWW